MKKLIRSITFTALILCLLALTGCGKKSTGMTVSPADLAKQLATETVTSDTLTETSADILASTYFVDSEKIDSSSAYMSTGASACEVAVIKCKDASYTSDVQKLFEQRVSTRPLCTLPTMQKRPKTERRNHQSLRPVCSSVCL